MNKKATIAIAGLVAVALGVTLLPSEADAHHPEIELSSVCLEPNESLLSVQAKAWEFWDDGTTTVSNDRRYNPDVRVEISNPATSWVEIGHGEFTDQNNFSFTVNSVQPNAAGSVRVRVRSVAAWGPNGEYPSFGDTREAVIDLSDDCAPTTSTTSATSTTSGASSVSEKTPTNAVTIARDFPATPVELTPRFAG